MRISQAKIGDVVNLFLDKNGNVTDNATDITLPATVIIIQKAGHYMVGWPRGNKRCGMGYDYSGLENGMLQFFGCATQNQLEDNKAYHEKNYEWHNDLKQFAYAMWLAPTHTISEIAFGKIISSICPVPYVDAFSIEVGNIVAWSTDGGSLLYCYVSEVEEGEDYDGNPAVCIKGKTYCDKGLVSTSIGYSLQPNKRVLLIGKQ